jgi:hypothetical protein
LHLEGAAAASVRQALAAPGDVRQSLGILSALLVVVSALSFARALQRMYEQAFRLRPLGGVRGIPATLVWIALIPAWLTARDGVDALFGGLAGTILSLALAAAGWTMTPFVLLGRRLPWGRLVPVGVLTAVAMSAVAASAVVYMTRAAEQSAGRYGIIGVAFSLLGWLVAAGFALVDAGEEDGLCEPRLLATEERARAGGLGLWREDRYKPVAASDFDRLLELTGRFALVEGRIRSVGERAQRTYLNFGADWSKALTITISKRTWRRMLDAGLSAATLRGRRVRARGTIERWNGPTIALTAPELMEILDEGAPGRR